MQAAAEGFAAQRPSKASAGLLRLLRLLRGAQNVSRSSFEAQQKQLVGPREAMAKQAGRLRKLLRRVLRLNGLRKLLRGF